MSRWGLIREYPPACWHMLAPLTWDDRMACVLKIPGSPISAAPATSTRAASDVWTAGATGAEKDMWMDQWKVITYYIYTYLIYGMNIYLPAILVSPGYEPFAPYPYWPEIYILNIFLSVFEIELISLITWLNNIFWTCFEPGLYRSFLPPNLEPWFLPVFLSQRGHIAGPPAAVAVQRAMVRSWDLEFCLGTLAKKGLWF